jgi:manganese/zinc/iron transport system permease protein
MADLPAGAVIVLAAAAVFCFSLLFGTARGLVRTLRERARLRARILRENLLRELFEWYETAVSEAGGPTVSDLLPRRSWSLRRLIAMRNRLQKEGQVTLDEETGSIRFTESGEVAAHSVVRKHRLWETYLITHADTAPGHVDWGADAIEHVLDEELVRELERKLEAKETDPMPESPHTLRPETEPV